LAQSLLSDEEEERRGVEMVGQLILRECAHSGDRANATHEICAGLTAMVWPTDLH
jgi:hypothetical protein